MTFAELIKLVSSSSGVTSVQVRKVLDAMGTVVTEALSADGNCRIPNFMRLSVKEIPEHDGWDPHSQKKMLVKATVSVKAKPSKNLVNPLKSKYESGQLKFLGTNS